MGMLASNVVTHKYSTASFGLKMRIEKVGGNREMAAVSSNGELFQFRREDEV